MSKFRNRKVKVNGEVFDSKKEYRRYVELLMLQRAGKISDLQGRFRLQEKRQACR